MDTTAALPRPVHTSLGLVTTIDEAEQAFVETVARIRVTDELGGSRPADHDDKAVLGDALQDALDLDVVALFTTYRDRIDATAAQFRAEVAARGNA
jgi:hypothetical protein